MWMLRRNVIMFDEPFSVHRVLGLWTKREAPKPDHKKFLRKDQKNAAKTTKSYKFTPESQTWFDSESWFSNQV